MSCCADITPNGLDQRAQTQALLDVAGAAAAATGVGRRVRLGLGRFLISGTLYVPSRVVFCGQGSELTELRRTTTWNPPASEADAMGNAMLAASGSALPAVLSTTLAESSAKGQYAIKLESAGTLQPGQHLRIGPWHNDQADDESEMSDADGVLLCETVEVAASYVPGALEVPLSRKPRQAHAVGAPVCAWLPSERVRIEGMDVAAEGGSIAVGLLLSGCADVQVRDVSGAGFSRALVDFEAGTWGHVHRLWSRGECNAVLMVTSSFVLDGDEIGASPSGKRTHALGVPRWTITVTNRSSVNLYGGSIGNGSGGLRRWGGHGCSFANFQIYGVDPAEAIARDHVGISGGIVGVGVDGGSGGLLPEVALESTYVNVHVEEPIQPEAEGACAWWVHDERRTKVLGCSVVSKGRGPRTTVLGQTYYACGVRVDDAEVDFSGMIVQGVDFGLRTDGLVLLTGGGVLFSAGAYDTNGIIAFYLNHAVGSVNLDRCWISNYASRVRFGPEFAPDAHLRLCDLRTDSGEWQDARYANNPGPPVSTGDPWPGGLVVAIGAPYDYGTGPILVALPA